MNLDDTPAQAEFRATVRAWIEEHRDEAPPLAGSWHVHDPAPYRRWQRRLAEARLIAVDWPEEYGGAGLGPVEQSIVSEELRRAGCGGIADHIAIGHLGPTIIAHGTEEQKQRYLGPMLHGEEGWCQAFSEPAAGSDLAALTTRARRTDGGWRLTGQKVWSTMAQHADFALLLARSNPDVPKHAGLTMFIVPMHAGGVTVRPLRQSSGGEFFNEIFLDDVEVGDELVVGEVGRGWTVALYTLMKERLAVLATFEELGWSVERFVEPIADHPGVANPHTRQRIAELACALLSLRVSSQRALSALSHGRALGPEAALDKISVIDAARKGCELLADLLGPDALEGEWGELAADLTGLRSAGGTPEIMRNVIGERILGLPPEPRFDKELPFSELGNGRAARAVPA